MQAPGGGGTRPLLARIRKSVCDTLAPRFPGARVLDLYAGSGSFGIEAVSRGAALAVLVESNSGAIKAIRANLSHIGAGDIAVVLGEDAASALKAMVTKGEEFDIIFLDPPFRAFDAGIAQAAAGILADGGILALRTSRGIEPSGRLENAVRIGSRNYGISRVTFYEREAQK